MVDNVAHRIEFVNRMRFFGFDFVSIIQAANVEIDTRVHLYIADLSACHGSQPLVK